MLSFPVKAECLSAFSLLALSALWLAFVSPQLQAKYLLAFL